MPGSASWVINASTPGYTSSCRSSAFSCVILDLNVKVIADLVVPFKNFVNRFVCLLLLFYGAKYYT